MAPTLTERIDSLSKEIDTLSKECQNDEDARKKLLGSIMQGMGKVESPLETIWKLIMSPHSTSALMTVIRAGLLPPLVSNKEPQTAKQLSEATGAEELLIIRLMRPLTQLGIFHETAPQTYTSTPISQLLIAPPLQGGYEFMFAGATGSLAGLPFYLERNGFKNVSGAPGPFQDFKKNPDMGMFDWLNAEPRYLTNFNNFMSGQRMNRKDWYDFFPVDEILFKDADSSSDSVLFIDIAGGEGHDADAFHKRFPDHPGKVVLQDLPPTIDNIKEDQIDSAVVRIKHDFFTEQPIKGAKAYYFRSIFHDWPDSECVKILKQTAAAMKKGYSKLLIFEFILPEQNTPLYPALLDINMMALLNGMERMRSQWTAILEEAGLKITKFWTIADDVEGLIEAELA